MSQTTEPFTAPSIVVGVDGSPAAQRAALWALHEAVGRELGLRLVAAVAPGDNSERARTALRAAESAITGTGKPVTVTTEVIDDDPVAALLTASAAAAMVCIGAVGLEHSRHGVGSTVEALVASARCPVAVVRGADHRGWVVVEIDESPDSAAVLQAGVEEARLRDAPLRVLGTWQSRDPDGNDAEERGRLVRARLDRRLETWRHRYPDLDVEPVAVHGGGLAYLSAHSASIQLVVVAARNITAVAELLGRAGSAALPGAAVLVVDPQRLL